MMTPSRAWVTASYPSARNTTAPTVTMAPIAWANRLGGPATGLAVPNRGAAKRVASWPKGLSVGPVRTRAEEAVGENCRNPQPAVPRDHTQPERERRQQHDAAGHAACRLLVDRVREAEQFSCCQ